MTGIELSARTVSDSLKSDSRFSLIEGDIAQLEIRGSYDICIYGAVHHHVLNHHGLGSAVSVLQKLAACCNSTLFFETGQLIEGGRWDWQRAMYRYFRTDEAHLHYCLSTIEHQIDNFQTIGRFWMHGVRRALIKIDLRPHEQRRIEPVPANVIAIREAPMELYGRTFGSRGQRLLPLQTKQVKDSPAWFGVTEDIDGNKLFLKRHVHRPAAAIHEYKIGQQIPYRWAVKCIGIADGVPALVFPEIRKFRNVTAVAGESNINRRAVSNILLSVFADARRASITVDARLLFAGGGDRSILHLCDMNPANLLVVGEDESITVYVVDFEQHSRQYEWRNRLHLGYMLFKLRHRRFRAAAQFLFGVLGFLRLLVEYQFRSVDRRISDRQPAIMSMLVTFVRTCIGRFGYRALKLVGYG